MERSWVEKFYSECGREVTLANNIFHQTNNWGITLTTGIVGAVFIAAIKSAEGSITIAYPNIAYWFVLILAWVIMTRFFVRSCLALVNMYRWNTLIYAASKILSLPESHSQVQVFERNFAKKVKAYFYDWRSPIPLRKLLWECFRLIYIWFFLILFGLIIWGFVVLYGQTLWLVGLLIFLLATTWEIYSLLKWRGFKYQPLHLENEPDITTLWPGGGKVETSSKTTGGKPPNNLLKKQVVAQGMTYFVFGLLSILAFMITPSKSLTILPSHDIWNTVMNICEWLIAWAFVPIGAASMLWAVTLLFIRFKWSVVEGLKESTLQRIQWWNEFFYWPALVTTFGVSFASVWARIINAGTSEPFLFAVYGLGIIVLLSLLAHHILAGRQ